MTVAKTEFALCDECTHKEQKNGETFYCKMHDAFYTNNEQVCEDFEESERYESDIHACD